MSTTTTRSRSRSLRFRPGRESYGVGIAELAGRDVVAGREVRGVDEEDTIMVQAGEAFQDRGGVKRRRIGRGGDIQGVEEEEREQEREQEQEQDAEERIDERTADEDTGIRERREVREIRETRERRGRNSGVLVGYGRGSRNADNMAKARAARTKRNTSLRKDGSADGVTEGRGLPVRERGREDDENIGREVEVPGERGGNEGEYEEAASKDEDVNMDMDMDMDMDVGDTITISMHNSLPSPPAEDEKASSIEVDIGSASASPSASAIYEAREIEQKPLPPSRGSGAKRDKRVRGQGKDEGEGKGEHKDKEKERNIKEVVFGDICFKSWYSSWYSREIIGLNHGAGTAREWGAQGHIGGGGVTKGNKSGNGKGSGSGKSGGGGGGSAAQVERLWVCGWCFAYSLSKVEMGLHREMCRRKVEGPPGRRIYVHGDGGRDRNEDMKRDEMDRGGEEKGEWSVWEVDGEEEVTFSQSLSLFAKLFLDNKSVFYDTTSFNYFLLVYSSPGPSPATVSRSPSSSASTSKHASPSHPLPNHQIVGFFSKEKMSWDNNNLACILIFPPWQKKGLGALLMGISYEIARREGILGGPEKPISELGRKGYARYWGAEVARWLLGFEEDGVGGKGKGNGLGEANGKGTAKGKGKGKGGKGLGKGWRKGMKGVGMNGRVSNGAAAAKTVEVEDVPRDCGICTVEMISKGTWIAVEDCLVVLRGMGVLDGGDGEGKEKEKEKVDGDGDGEGKGNADENGNGEKKVKIDKERVRQWVEKERISLEKHVREEGFVEGYGYPEEDVEEDEEAGSAEEGMGDSADELG